MPPHHRLFRLLTGVAVVTATFAAGADVAAAPCWRPPVAAPITDRFREPACRWCPGNRGIEYATPPGQSVFAVDTGRVTFAGAVAGVLYVVVEHRDGLRVTYGRLAAARPRRGDLVVRHQLIGTAGNRFYFGVRRGSDYLDPAPMMGELFGRRRLVPLDGRRPAPSPPPTLRCSS